MLRLKDITERAVGKKLTPQDQEGSTFTISNLGMYGVESFTSIINQPNSAILSIAGTKEMPVVRNGEVVIRPHHEDELDQRPPCHQRSWCS